jgi:hypothetical protein
MKITTTAEAFVAALKASKPGWIESSDCIEAGVEQLGLSLSYPQIFHAIGLWPEDLIDEYTSNGPRWRVIAALKALQRLLPDGSIDPNPKAVHTRLPQLNKLLKMRTTIALKS